LRAPARVNANKCYCFYDDGINQVCIDDTIDTKVGWEFTQEYQIYTGVNSAGAAGTAQYYYKLRA
jgi:hypothetical protein